MLDFQLKVNNKMNILKSIYSWHHRRFKTKVPSCSLYFPLKTENSETETYTSENC